MEALAGLLLEMVEAFFDVEPQQVYTSLLWLLLLCSTLRLCLRLL